MANDARQQGPREAGSAGVAALDRYVWQRGYHAVAVIGASKNAGKTTALNALCVALAERKERAGLCSVGVDGEASDVWLATPKPAVAVVKGTLVVTSLQAAQQAGATLKVLQTLDFTSSLGPVVLAEARTTGTVLLSGLAHRGQLTQAIARLRAAGADRVVVDGAYHRQAAADTDGIDAVVLAIGAIVPLEDAVPTLRALSTPQDRDAPQTRDVPGGLTDARLALLDLTDVAVLRVVSLGAVLLSGAGHARLARLGVRLTARQTRPLACVTANPHRPDRGDDVAASAFVQQVAQWVAQHGVNVPVVDVVAGVRRDRGET